MNVVNADYFPRTRHVFYNYFRASRYKARQVTHHQSCRDVGSTTYSRSNDDAQCFTLVERLRGVSLKPHAQDKCEKNDASQGTEVTIDQYILPQLFFSKGESDISKQCPAWEKTLRSQQCRQCSNVF